MIYYFDFDSTLIDTRSIRAYRRNVEGRRWVAENPTLGIFNTTIVNPKLLELIKSLGDKAAVITNSPEDYTRALLTKHRFPEIEVFGSANKPCTSFHVPGDSVYIGDEPRDALYGHEERIGSIAYTEKGFFSQEKIEKSLPSAQAKTFSELEKLLSEKLVDEPRDLSAFTALSENPTEVIPIHFIQKYCPNSRDKVRFKETDSGDILSYKRAKDCTWKEIQAGYPDSFVYLDKQGKRVFARGKSYLSIVSSFCQKIKAKVESLDLKGTVHMVAVPNSLPEFAYLCDINFKVASEFNQESKGRTLYRIKPVKEAHSTGSRNPGKHIGTLAIHKNPILNFNVDNLILLDDITTTGTQFQCAAALLRQAGYQNNIVGLALGKTIE